MPPDRIAASHFSPDTQDFIRLLNEHHVRYLIVGGEAVIFYGYARLTGDVDFFFDGEPSNAQRLFEALLAFWGGDIPAVRTPSDLTEPGLILQFGRPPHRLDLMNRIEGVDFEAAWAAKKEVRFALEEGIELPLYYLGLRHLIVNKQATGRPKDQEDLIYLRQIAEP